LKIKPVMQNITSEIPLIIFGAGGISRETANLIEDINERLPIPRFNILGFVSESSNGIGKEVSGWPIVTCDAELFSFAGKYASLSAAIPVGNPVIKKQILEKIISSRTPLLFPNIIHPAAWVKPGRIHLGEGNIVAAGVQMTLDVTIGNHNLFNLNCTIGHDVAIGDYCVINPACSISGRVVIEDGVFIGTGARILENLHIGKNSVIGAGAVVTKNVESGKTVVGIPARAIK
jgi:sugar O-acyltransferase (sialic acid O-acetyltransferase NeuD family)